LGLLTLLGVAKRGWFIPYRYAESLPAPGTARPYAAIEALFHRREPGFAELLAEIERHGEALRAIGKDAPPAPRWNQDWFPRLDAAAAYALVRRERPNRIVEVGSGHSTRFMARAVADGGLATRITAIDPAPRATLRGLAIEFIPRTLQAAGDAPFAALAAGDVLFIDSSHVLMPDSDVDYLLGRVLPILPTGVLVHVHDIFLPDGYPPAWAWRGYNEQQGVLGLLHGGAWRVEFASRYVVTRMAPLLKCGLLADLPLIPGAFESSLWLRKL
jgi:predicted O-methyltransferase YrrM